jgi:hypothetical protein
MTKHVILNSRYRLVTNPIEVNEGYVQFAVVTHRGRERTIEVPMRHYLSKDSFKYCGDIIRFINT